MIQNKKSSIILILKVLEEYSDSNHFLTQKEIIDKIDELYGIELERKSIGSSLELLQELDYDIVRGERGGFALLSRTFDTTEASFLIDAIFSSRSIDGKMAKKISSNVYSCFSKYERQDYSYIYKSMEVTRTCNKDVLFNISIIQEAIKRNKQIGFQYLTYDENGKEIFRKDGYIYHVSPYYLINNFGRYYLLCNYNEKYNNFNIFRLDYMVNIQIDENRELKRINELKNPPKDFSITKFINEHIYISTDEVINAELILDGSWCIQFIKDWFGESAKIKNINGEIHAYISCDESSLYYWVMQYSSHVKVVSPSKFVEKIKEGLKNALKKYE